ncbi:MAG: SUMF1/EgtB/PvdO family nonheme iron enzyme [Planctomycetes bacterium]|nr:SUMF1/EgtB/PvdO family nonheme iron enzyme [Planctomycetota bacterium]
MMLRAMNFPNPPPDSDGPSPVAPDPSFLEQLWARYADSVEVTRPSDAIRIGEPDPSSSPSIPVDRVATRYLDRGEIARGGMGAIRRVWDDDLRRELAMKVALERVANDPVVLGRFLEEAQITGQLEHPGIVPVHEIGFDAEGRLYFTMRLVRGHDLRTIFQWVREGHRDWSLTRALNVILRVCEAVAYAHSRKVIHRDLKPANVMVGSFGEVYVMDWGLAKVRGSDETAPHRGVAEPGALDSADATVMTDRRAETRGVESSPLLTEAGAVVGTPAFMAPEQARGELEQVDARTDVYAVGALLYSLLTGRMPFVDPGDTPTAADVIARVRESSPTPIQQIDRRLPSELVAICEKAMSRDRDERYPDMLAMRDDLRAYLEQRVVRAHRTGPWAEFVKWVQRNRGLAIALASLLGITTIGSWVFTWTTGRQYREIVKLEDLKVLSDLRVEAETLYPARPEMVEMFDEWIRRFDRLRPRAPLHRTSLENLRAVALPYDDTQRAADQRAHPRFAEWQTWTRRRQRVQGRLDIAVASNDASKIANEQRVLGIIDGKISELWSAIENAPRQTWRFADSLLQWQHDSLQEFVHELTLPNSSSRRLYENVQARRSFALQVESLTLGSTEARAAWTRAIDSIARSELYDHLELTPQLGLVPLEPNEQGLWEFWHPLTGERPMRAADPRAQSRWIMAESTGMVFILLPGTTFAMGSTESEGEPRPPSPNLVTLSPFFISKYETTQAQWERFTGENPSVLGPGDEFAAGPVRNVVDRTHPVEFVSWFDCNRELGRMVLSLPTEAQWEYAARGGARAAYWFGSDPAGVQGRANYKDRSYWEYTDSERKEIDSWPDDTDGYIPHGPVDAFPANPFGLHGVLGNVREWCLERLSPYANPVFAGTGERDILAADKEDRRLMRGGNYRDDPSACSSIARYYAMPGYRERWVGVRPVRAIDP